MTASTPLERRYRRLLAFYPRPFRREQGPEILSVLMACAPAGQRWPGLAESANLLGNAIQMRLRYGIEWEHTHYPVLWIWVRVLTGIWLLILTGLLCGARHWWGLSLLAPAALHFYVARRTRRAIQR
jgi:hypothetical protein